MVNKKAKQVQLIAFDHVLAQHCMGELSPLFDIERFFSMEDLETSLNTPCAVLYLMGYTSFNHLHNIAFIRNKYPESLFFVIATAVSIPLLHQSLHIGINDLFIYPLSDSDKQALIHSLKQNTDIACVANELENASKISTVPFIRDNPIASLFNIIEQDFAKGPSLHELSHQIHLSPSRLCHMFKDLCGITYSHYLLCRRLEESERLLTNNDSSITTIAYQLGFSNPSHFCRCFKEHFNVTPTSFANGNRDVEQSSTLLRYQRLRSELLPSLVATVKNTDFIDSGKQRVL